MRFNNDENVIFYLFICRNFFFEEKFFMLIMIFMLWLNGRIFSCCYSLLFVLKLYGIVRNLLFEYFNFVKFIFRD